MSVRLLALDLDGTLVDAMGWLPEENRQAIAAARAAGIQVVLVTGRSWRETRGIYQMLGLRGPSICYLGAMVVADGSGQVRYHRPMNRSAWHALATLAVAEGLSVTACVGVASENGTPSAQGMIAADTAFATCRTADFAAWDAWNPYTEMAPDLSSCQEPPIMAAIYGPRAVARVLEAFPDGLPESQYDLSDRTQEETVLHIWHSEANKGAALAQVCESMGVAPQEVVAIGDATADLPMFRYAGLAVAVPDAPLEIQAEADLVASPAEAIRRILAGS